MTDDLYLIAITALLPLTALMLVLQANPYQALVMRGILGAIAALVYALFGAADVALTEALVGTMLSITLYAVAVRSSMEMRLGWVQPPARPAASEPSSAEVETIGSGTRVIPKAEAESAAESVAESESKSVGQSEAEPESASLNATLVTALRKALKPNHLRLEILPYPSPEALEIALRSKRIHSAVVASASAESLTGEGATPLGPYRIQTRVRRLYELLGDRLPPDLAEVDYLDLAQPSAPQSAIPQAQPLPPRSAQESS